LGKKPPWVLLKGRPRPATAPARSAVLRTDVAKMLSGGNGQYMTLRFCRVLSLVVMSEAAQIVIKRKSSGVEPPAELLQVTQSGGFSAQFGH